MSPKTLGELRRAGRSRSKSIKDEVRQNLMLKLSRGETLFPGIVGYRETVIPQIVNALLSKHNLILLGLRGQAKSRILRALTDLLDSEVPCVEGCEINDDPFFPICEQCCRRVREDGDQVPIRFMRREDRYVEKLATPDVTIADIIGDLDPIKAARAGRQLSSQENIHFGLLPRANRGIFAINELPDLAPKIQVGLFNIMQEGDVQIKGFPVRLPLDVLLVFSANPEDYTARGKIITPLKDRIGTEVRTHYPRALEDGIRITQQEAWTDRECTDKPLIPKYVREVVELVAFLGREDGRIDKRSGVSQRLPITCLENCVSNAERRAVTAQEKETVLRIADVYAAVPSITGKLELEYEGELKGSETIARELIEAAVLQTFDKYFGDRDFDQIVQWFNLGGQVKVGDQTPSSEYLYKVESIQGLREHLRSVNVNPREHPGLAVSTIEFILEGLHAQNKLSRTEEQGYVRTPEKVEKEYFQDFPGRRRSFN